MAATRFTQADVTRALKGARAADVAVQRVEIDRDGRLVIYTGAAECERDEWNMTPLEIRRARRGES